MHWVGCGHRVCGFTDFRCYGSSSGRDVFSALFGVVEAEVERDVSGAEAHEIVCLVDPGSYRTISETVDKDAAGV